MRQATFRTGIDFLICSIFVHDRDGGPARLAVGVGRRDAAVCQKSVALLAEGPARRGLPPRSASATDRTVVEAPSSNRCSA